MRKGFFLPSEQGNLHVAIIMDGNGRWANQRGLPRIAGHRVGAETARKVIEAAPEFGIKTLTLYAFSSDNWHRPPEEVNALMDLLETYLIQETETCIRNKVRLSIIGRRDRLSTSLLKAIEHAEKSTLQGDVLHLRVAIDYSARDAILRAAMRLKNSREISREEFSRLISEERYNGHVVPDVDILVRTGGEKRLSDFLLWECAYAELFFLDTMWPDFTPEELEHVVHEFYHRERRFGRVPETAAVF